MTKQFFLRLLLGSVLWNIFTVVISSVGLRFYPSLIFVGKSRSLPFCRKKIANTLAFDKAALIKTLKMLQTLKENLWTMKYFYSRN